MPVIAWDKSVAVGVKDFDDHHKYLFSLLNTIFDGFARNLSPEKIRPMIDNLHAYSYYHIDAEEKWMQANNFPGLLRHREEHEKYCIRLMEFRSDFYSGKSDLLFDVLQFLQDWLVAHIKNSDIEFGKFSKL